MKNKTLWLLSTIAIAVLLLIIGLLVLNDHADPSHINSLVFSSVVGFLIAISLVGFLLFLVAAKLELLLLCAYAFVFALLVASASDFSLFEAEELTQRIALACIALILFIMASLILRTSKLSEVFTKSELIVKGARFSFLVSFIMALVLPIDASFLLFFVLALIAVPIISYLSIYSAWQNNLVARYLCSSWFLLILASLVSALNKFTLLDWSIDENSILLFCAIISALLIVIALTLKYGSKIEASGDVQDKPLDSEKLEYAIDERTLELEIALRELSEVNRELEALSAIDSLTELMNRRAFDKRLLAEARRSRREQTPLTLAILDIDFFKKINDTYGHQTGDTCLKVFSKVLKTQIKRPSDVLARYGGEEFVVLLPNTTIENAVDLMDAFRHTLEQTTISHDHVSFSITVSIGLTSKIIESDNEHEALVSHADKQLYKAKESGRNQVKAAAFNN